MRKIFDNAKICQFCGAYQNKVRQNFANFGYIASLVVTIISIGQVVLGFQQLGEARKARAETSQTLARAKQAEEGAQKAEHNALEALERVKEIEKNVKFLLAQATRGGL